MVADSGTIRKRVLVSWDGNGSAPSERITRFSKNLPAPKKAPVFADCYETSGEKQTKVMLRTPGQVRTRSRRYRSASRQNHIPAGQQSEGRRGVRGKGVDEEAAVNCHIILPAGEVRSDDARLEKEARSAG